MNELERFASLFSQQVSHTWDYAERIEPEQWVAVPVASDANFLGTRVNEITIAALLRHLCLAETHWFRLLPTIDEGATLPIPTGTGPLENLEPGPELIAAYHARHLASLQAIAQMPREVLDRSFYFIGRQFTVRGFLWTVYGHHCYHLGQVDQLMRQQNIMPPEFMEYAERQKLIA